MASTNDFMHKKISCILVLFAVVILLCINIVNTTLRTFLEKATVFYSKCPHVNNTIHFHSEYTEAYDGCRVNIWKKELDIEAYWMFKACPIYFFVDESSFKEGLYWDYAETLIDNDPDANVYMCDALETLYKREIIRILGNFMKPSVGNDRPLPKKELCNSSTELFRLIQRNGFEDYMSRQCRYWISFDLGLETSNQSISVH